MNSLGVSPFVHYLYSDLYDGLVIFQLYDYIQPGLVDWSKVTRKFNKMKANFERVGECGNVVVSLIFVRVLCFFFLCLIFPPFRLLRGFSFLSLLS